MNIVGKVIVGLSGGVDSSVAAMKLIQHGFHVEALFMKNWEEDDKENYCNTKIDLLDAQAVADKLGIKLHKVNFSSDYWEQVFVKFLSEYRAGRTPNPDILCNREIKFKVFLDYALKLNATHIATGHYAVNLQDHGVWKLLQAKDNNKDQTYFLCLLNQYQLSHTFFPLGSLKKQEVRKLAYKAGLNTHAKKDSMGICFIGKRHFRNFLSRYIRAKPGLILTADGNIIGQHQGLFYYTIGQRHGLRIGGIRNKEEEPWFVAAMDFDNNHLIVVQGHNHPLLYSSSLYTEKAHWISGEEPSFSKKYMARYRHRQQLQTCYIHSLRNKHLYVIFKKPQRAISPGQIITFYNGLNCLGGATIAKIV